MLVGFGYDIHRLEAGRPLRLGGVDIPGAESGPVAHSDGDVVLHALCDALLGAAGLGDIGVHFPDTDEAFRGVDSVVLLERVVAMLAREGVRPHNVDCTVVLERPRLAPHRPAMQESIARVLGIDARRVSMKATTNEKLGPIGAGEGIAAYAVATLVELA
jgi:2-C-methyl-D-erythritol 2,4-cyclodiphosphate synthase